MPTTPIPVILYTRIGCHLCDDAKALLDQFRKPFHLDIAEVDIDQDSQLRQRYDQCVPVIRIAGRDRLRGKINEVLLRRVLTAERQRDLGN